MIIGDKSTFAIDSGITQAYERSSFRALGYFALHIGGICYGVRKPDATMLACAFQEAGRMIADRGNHTTPFASETKACDIVDAIRNAIYAPNPGAERFFGLSIPEFSDFVYSSHCQWHLACDEAFDDGSGVLHFDVENRVRLIADRPAKEKYEYHHDSDTLREIWLEADVFYDVLERWHKAFEAEWKAAPKISESEDGAEESK